MVSSATMGTIPTANRGDIISKKPQTIEEKAKQIAVDKYDMTGAHIKVPTYFLVNYPNGETKALHHVRDAKAISDVIRQMKFEHEDDTQSAQVKRKGFRSGLIPLLAISTLTLFLMTMVILLGIF
ncbi:MAG: hypothetical protein F6K10_08045 [Moorea sp. SIO2B7]|nr:hypothetical protein [Moorena sp. SIO2B7]